MQVKIDSSALKQTRWYEFGVRFLFGGLITAGAGMIAKEFGPGVGGLFLAFPAIFLAGATLIEKHEKQKKERAGLHGSARGRKAAAVDAAGASIGSIGLFIFALVVKQYLVSYSPWLALMGATVIWLAVSLFLWQVRKRM
jgi:Protein of unknown function (DUF3147)